MDTRWIGPHGIGRFAREVQARGGFLPLNSAGKPLELLDPPRLSRTLSKMGIGHFFSPGFNAPTGRPCAFSFTIHDLIHLEVQSEKSPAKSIYYQLHLLPAARRASCIFTGSEFSKNRILEWSHLDTEQVIITGYGVAENFTPQGNLWLHPRPYLLYVGNHKPHKNLEGLIKAYRDSRLFRDVDLLLTGNPERPLRDLVARSSIETFVYPLGTVSEQVLPSLYRGALALIMPSFYEGFGLPVVEAMACGTPVISSRATALEAVGGKAIIPFDPENHEEFVFALEGARDTARLKALSLLGLEHVRQFEWEKVVGRIVGAIDARS